MALLLTESFDYWNNGITSVMWAAGGWTYYTSFSHYTDFFRHGSGSGYTGGYASKVLTVAEASSTLIVGLGVYEDAFAGGLDVVTFGAGSTDGQIGGCTPAVTVNISSDNRIRVYTGWGPAGESSVTQSGGSVGVLLAQSAVLPTFVDQWRYVEVKVTSARVVLNVEDVEVINVAHSGGTLDNVFFWNGFRMDDVYILNDDGAPDAFVGTGARVEVARPNGDDSVAWTLYGPGPNHWNALDSDNASGDPIGGGSVYTDVTGAVDLFSVTDLSIGSRTVHGVVVGARGYQVVGPRSLAMVAEVGPVTAESTETPLRAYGPPDYDRGLDRTGIFNTQPDGSPWDEASFNAAKFGIKAGTGSGTYAQVDRLVIQALVGPLLPEPGPGDIFLGKGRWWATPPEAVIERYDRDSTLRASYTDPLGFGYDHGAATDDGLTVFAVGYIAGSPPPPRIFKFDAETLGAPSVFTLGTYATDRTLNLKVRGGRLYCGQHDTTTSRQRIQQFDFDGALLNTWMVGGTTAYNSEAAFDVVGNVIYFASQNFSSGISHVARAVLNPDGSIGTFDSGWTQSAELPGESQVYDVGVFLDGHILASTYDTHYVLDQDGALIKTFYQDNTGHIYVAIDGAADETQYVSLPANVNIYEGSVGSVDLMDIDLPDGSLVDQPLFQITATGSGRRSSTWVRRFAPEIPEPPEPPCVPPANDNWDNARVLVGASGKVSGNNTCATLEPDEPIIVCSSPVD